jgi:peptide/nickel transport system permease protein
VSSGKSSARAWLFEPLKILWRSRRSRVGLVITISIFLLIVVGPFVLARPEAAPSKEFLLPSWTHPLGTDSLGRDVLADLAYGGAFILELSFIAALIGITIGTFVGIAGALMGGKVEFAVITATDIAVAIPGIILIIVVSQFIKATDPVTLGALLSIVSWAPFARIIRSQMLVLRAQPFVESVRMLGLPRRHIILFELLPNVMPYIAINFIFFVQGALFASVGLYFLGVLPYNPLNWGTMINQAMAVGAYLNIQGLSSFASPLIAVTLFAVGLILLSGGFEEIFNPRLRAK